ncbi:hypothetical protein [Accumulibacter sp.]|uniref:hypothetical protein n=1 Tax=Accumulibacter sp. TaxID=2053492 RepID=UPI00260DCFF8|nr:hypothetical protein [Accumulibacter sp.]
MQQFFRRSALAMLGGALMAPLYAVADRIPLGLDINRGIFVQEIWQARKPRLCVANRTGKDQTLLVSRWRSRAHPAEPLLQWPIEAGSTVCHKAGKLAGEALIEYRLADGGAALGLLHAPGAPATETLEGSGFASLMGINGTCPTPGTWTEQASLWIKGGQVASLDLLTTVGADGALLEFPVDTRLDLPLLKPRSAESSSLLIEHDGTRLAIKSRPDTVAATVHRVRLEFDVPEVKQPTMYLLSGRQRILQTGWQCFVRGILVEP